MEYQAKVSSKGQITIPKPVRDALYIDEKDTMLFIIHDDKEVRLIKASDQFPCKCRKQDCIVCLNTKKVDMSIPFFDHVAQVKKIYEYQLQVEFKSPTDFSVSCQERKLTPYETEILTKWVQQSINRKEWFHDSL